MIKFTSLHLILTKRLRSDQFTSLKDKINMKDVLSFYGITPSQGVRDSVDRNGVTLLEQGSRGRSAATNKLESRTQMSRLEKCLLQLEVKYQQRCK